ncbi:c-type cytochrome [Halomonas elongata]|uniref:c-type cytochrome n=1 Tax=Halomonas elongata TaxID=2746 RepID=UPI0023B19512|nr:cytochrome c [Halomonas elongata]
MMKTTHFGLLAGLLGMAMSAGVLADMEGEAVYSDNCLACHQAGGEGISGVFPALHDNTFVSGDADDVVRVLLNGRGGMPSFNGDLSSEQIASVTNFLRTHFNDAAGGIDVQYVDSLRTSDASTMEREE